MAYAEGGEVKFSNFTPLGDRPHIVRDLLKLAREIDKAKEKLAKTSVAVHFRKKLPTKEL